MDEQQRTQEMHYFALVSEKIREVVLSLEEERTEGDDRKQQLHDEMWEEMPHIVRDLDDAVNLLMHNRLVDQAVRSNELVEKELREHVALLLSPYFGRIDFIEETTEERAPVYIGKRSFTDQKAFKMYVHDWRAPISSMFYDFDCGPAFYESPDGTLRGVMPLKRHYRIVEGEMQAMFEADALVQDDILGHILAEPATGRLKAIASSIQKEQNAVVRSLRRQDTLILGPAGSGKTSVGLHRLAFLLYHNREKLRASQIVVVSANHAFNEYISTIMPDLYEDDVQRRVFHDLVAPAIPAGIHFESYYAQFDDLMTQAPDHPRVVWAKRLYSQEFLDALERHMSTLPIETFDIEYGGEVIETREAFDEYLRSNRDGMGYPMLWQRITGFLRSRIDAWFLRQDSVLRDRIQTKVHDGELDIMSEGEMKAHLRRQREECMQAHRARIRSLNGLDAQQQLLRMIDGYAQNAQISRAIRKRFAKGELLYEDVLALLCARGAMGELKPVQGVSLVLVDEAQDYGPLQHYLLRCLFPRCDFTLLADVHQCVLPAIGMASPAAFHAIHPIQAEFLLTRSYRFTAAIGALAANLIAERAAISYYDRPGERPLCIAVDDLPSAVAKHCADAPGTVAVLTTTLREARELSRALQERLDHVLLTPRDDTEGKVTVMPFYLAKGLEFDRVILADCGTNGLGSADPASTYYLLCTRALHELVVLHTRELPSELAACIDCMQMQA